MSWANLAQDLGPTAAGTLPVSALLMHEKFREVCVQQIRLLAEAVRQGRAGRVHSQHIFGHPEDRTHWEKLVERVARTSPWKEHVLRSEVVDEIDSILHQLAAQPDLNVFDRLEEWEAKVRGMELRLEILPVQGVVVLDRPLLLGKVKFWHLDRHRIEGLVRFTVTSTGAPKILVDDLKQNLIDQLDGLRDTTVALYRASGSAQRTRHDAIMEVRRVLPVLRALTMLDFYDPLNVDIAVSGDARSIWQEGFALSRRGGGFGRSARIGAGFPVSEVLFVNANKLSSYQALGLQTVQEALSSNLPADAWASTLALTYEWLGTAQQALRPEAALLSLAVALEVLFSTSHQGLTQTIADGVAFLTGKDRRSRLARVDQVIKLYELRSKITHGTPTQVSWTEVNQLRGLLHEVLVAAVHASDGWTKRADFQAHLKILKYGNQD